MLLEQVKDAEGYAVLNLGVAHDDLIRMETVAVADHILVEHGAVDKAAAILVAGAEGTDVETL